MRAEGEKGVYRVFDPATGESFVGWSNNLGAMLKRMRFELGLNACPYKAVQAFCNAHPDFELEALEQCGTWDAENADSEEEILARLTCWQNRLGAGTRIIQSSATI